MAENAKNADRRSHTVGTQEEWQAARNELLKREQELGELDEELAKRRAELPWVRVEKDYFFDTEDGPKSLPELFDGRSQLLIYHLMFGPSYEVACPGCTALADHLDGALPHVNYRDVTLMCMSRAPIEKLSAYKRRMGWRFPYVSSGRNDFNLDWGFAMTEEQMASPEMAEMVNNPPAFLQEWAKNVGTELALGMREAPGWNVFAMEDEVVYHTYSRTAPDRMLVEPYFGQLLDQVPSGRGSVEDFPMLRHDEY
jgi:predicted dithiol-disulfide oxidoreductase (DUF899 family)